MIVIYFVVWRWCGWVIGGGRFGGVRGGCLVWIGGEI